MTPEERAAEAPLVDPDELADAVVELVRDESFAGRGRVLAARRERLALVCGQSCCKTGVVPARRGRRPWRHAPTSPS